MSTTQAQQVAKQVVKERQPSPAHFFETMHAYQQTAALKTAVELDLFTAIGCGLKTVPELAQKCQSSERGVRALADFLVVLGFIEKKGEEYCLTIESGIFLDKKSTAFLGPAIEFLASPTIMEGFNDLTAVVRSGGPDLERNKRLHSDPAIWVAFARGMAPLVRMTARATEKIIRADSEIKVLDIAAGHGLYGITVAQHNPKADAGGHRIVG